MEVSVNVKKELIDLFKNISSHQTLGPNNNRLKNVDLSTQKIIADLKNEVEEKNIEIKRLTVMIQNLEKKLALMPKNII